MSRGKQKNWLPENTVRTTVDFIRMHKSRIKRYKEIVADIVYESPNNDGMPRGSDITDTTSSKAIRVEEKTRKLSSYIKDVDSALYEVDPIFRDVILIGVEYWMSYEKINARYGCPCGKNEYYKKRREFIYRVAENLCLI